MSERRRPRFSQVPLGAVPGRERRSAAVLNLGYDPPLLETRSIMLKNAGFRVRSVASAAAALHALSFQAFDVIILCHTVPERQRREVIEAARKRTPSVKTVVLYRVTRAEAEGADVALDSHDGPEALVSAVQSPPVTPKKSA